MAMNEPAKAKGSLAHDGAEEFSPPMIHLTHEHMKKFGIKQMPKVGSKVKISGLVHVGSTSESDHGSSQLTHREGGEGEGTQHSMTLHLHKMEMGQDGQKADHVDKEAQTQKGMKGAIDAALQKDAGSEKSKAKAAGGKEKSKSSGG